MAGSGSYPWTFMATSARSIEFGSVGPVKFVNADGKQANSSKKKKPGTNAAAAAAEVQGQWADQWWRIAPIAQPSGSFQSYLPCPVVWAGSSWSSDGPPTGNTVPKNTARTAQKRRKSRKIDPSTVPPGLRHCFRTTEDQNITALSTTKTTPQSKPLLYIPSRPVQRRVGCNRMAVLRDGQVLAINDTTATSGLLQHCKVTISDEHLDDVQSDINSLGPLITVPWQREQQAASGDVHSLVVGRGASDGLVAAYGGTDLTLWTSSDSEDVEPLRSLANMRDIPAPVTDLAFSHHLRGVLDLALDDIRSDHCDGRLARFDFTAPAGPVWTHDLPFACGSDATKVTQNGAAADVPLTCLCSSHASPHVLHLSHGALLQTFDVRQSAVARRWRQGAVTGIGGSGRSLWLAGMSNGPSKGDESIIDLQSVALSGRATDSVSSAAHILTVTTRTAVEMWDQRMTREPYLRRIINDCSGFAPDVAHLFRMDNDVATDCLTSGLNIALACGNVDEDDTDLHPSSAVLVLSVSTGQGGGIDDLTLIEPPVRVPRVARNLRPSTLRVLHATDDGRSAVQNRQRELHPLLRRCQAPVDGLGTLAVGDSKRAQCLLLSKTGIGDIFATVLERRSDRAQTEMEEEEHHRTLRCELTLPPSLGPVAESQPTSSELVVAASDVSLTLEKIMAALDNAAANPGTNSNSVTADQEINDEEELSREAAVHERMFNSVLHSYGYEM
eukprot:Clim_evm71s22 gene=Clim_evmTU71s22